MTVSGCHPGRQARYTDAAIQTILMVRAAFKLPLRQAECLMASVLTLMDLTISVPDHTTVSRRTVMLPVIQAAGVPPGPLHDNAARCHRAKGSLKTTGEGVTCNA
jgi:hypothetical protein